MPVIYAVRPQPKVPYYYRARPNQDFFLDEFLTPLAKEVQKIVSAVSGETLEAVGPRLFEVNLGVRYVLDREVHGVEEFFQYPFETLALKTGDCEDQAYLLASMLTAAGVPNVLVVFGTAEINAQRFGHAWVEAQGCFIESTDTRWRPLDSRPDFYFPEIAVAWGYSFTWGVPIAWRFNSEEVTRELPKPSPEDIDRLRKRLEEWEAGGGQPVGAYIRWL